MVMLNIKTDSMKKLTILLLLLASLLNSCNKPDIAKSTPKCIKKEIKDLNKSSISCEDYEVEEYIFQEKTVFVFSPGTCGDDLAVAVLDSDCNYLGSLGGLAGNKTINGEDFFSNAIFIKTIWKK